MVRQKVNKKKKNYVLCLFPSVCLKKTLLKQTVLKFVQKYPTSKKANNRVLAMQTKLYSVLDYLLLDQYF